MQKLVGVDIFATGKWNGDVYTEKDLDDMVSAFREAPIKPPLKLGHDESQAWFGQKDGAPALGWVDKLYRAGRKLMADFADVPNVVVDLIRTGKYRSKSAEIYWNFEADGRKWPRALKAVSLLGADIPAVSSLEDLQKVLLSSNTASASYTVSGTTTGTTTTGTITQHLDLRKYDYEQPGGNMDGELEKKYKEDLAAKDGLISSRDATIADLKKSLGTAEERALKAEAELVNRDEKFAMEKFSAKVDELVRAGKVLPAEKDRLVRTFCALGAGVRKFEDKEYSPRDEFVKGLEDRPVIVTFREKGKGGEDESGDLPPAAQVDRAVRKLMSEKNCTYAQGIEALKSTDPDLWMSYVRPEKKEA